MAAAAVIVSCAKSEVAYDNSSLGEVSISPVAGNITKAAITDAVFPQDNHIGLFAFHSKTTEAGTVSDYSAFSTNYLLDAEFAYRNNTVWAGLQPYYWPINGSMVFAGYSLPAPAAGSQSSAKNGTVSYALAEDCLKILNYTQSHETTKTYDLLYFGRTSSSFDKKTASVPVVFSHALSWIEIQVKGGTGALVSGREWAITDITLASVDTKGTFTFTGTAATDAAKAVWSDQNTANDMVIYQDKTVLTSAYQKIETTDGGTLVIPQGAKILNVTIAYKSPAGADIVEDVPIDLSKFTQNWEAGKKYIYKLTFDPAEILVAPEVQNWPSPVTTEEKFN